MPQAPSSIFNKKATEKLRSPDDLDKYVRVTNPSVWVVIAACLALLAGLLAWGLLGSVTTRVTTTGACVEGKVVCFLSTEDAEKVDEGDIAIVDGNRMVVADVSAVPMSRGEADKVLSSDYLVSTLVNGDWAYQVTFEGDTSNLTENVPISVSITVERIAPISLLFGRDK